MRSKRRVAAVLALAAAGSLAVAGIAYAAISSTATLKFTPSNLPTSTFQNGGLNVHTHTNYSDVNSQYTDRAQLNFDNDIKVNTSATPKCNKTNISGTKTMAQAMAACGSSLIGKGTATAAAGANVVHACVLAFNGSGTGGHVLLFTRANVAPPFTISCSNPSSNTQGNTNVLLDGTYSTNPSSLGTRLRERQAAAVLEHPRRVGSAADGLQRDRRQAHGAQLHERQVPRRQSPVEPEDQVHLQLRDPDGQRDPDLLVGSTGES